MRAEMLSGLVRPAVTLTLVLVFCVLVVMSRPIPESFTSLVTLVVGFWFGQRVGRTK